MNIGNQKGLSLVEVIIVMIIALVLATIVITVYITQAREVAESMAYAQVQRGHDNFLEQFGRDIRFASRVFYYGENEKSVDIVRENSIIRYTVNTGVITRDAVETVGAADTDGSTPFDIGGEDVLNVDATESSFEITGSDFVKVTLKLTYDDGKTVFDFAPREDKFKCRN